MNITLFVPGLFHRFPEISDTDIDQLACHELAGLLSRSGTGRHDTASTGLHADEWLYQQFCHAHTPNSPIPYAAIMASEAGMQAGEDYWMRADPVCLYPDTHSLILQDPEQLQLEKQESVQLHNAVADLFDWTGAELIPAFPGQWYLRFTKRYPELRCVALPDAIAKPANNLLPVGPDRKGWHRLLNEIQMVFNGLSLNRQREAAGKMPVNSLWFWGEGVLPQDTEKPYDFCIGDSAFMRGLCRLSGCNTLPLNAINDAESGFTAGRDVLVVEDRLQRAVDRNNPEYWLAALSGLEQQVISPLVKMIAKTPVRSVAIRDTGREYYYRPGSIWRRWRPRRPLSRFTG